MRKSERESKRKGPFSCAMIRVYLISLSNLFLVGQAAHAQYYFCDLTSNTSWSGSFGNRTVDGEGSRTIQLTSAGECVVVQKQTRGGTLSIQLYSMPTSVSSTGDGRIPKNMRPPVMTSAEYGAVQDCVPYPALVDDSTAFVNSEYVIWAILAFIVGVIYAILPWVTLLRLKRMHEEFTRFAQSVQVGQWRKSEIPVCDPPALLPERIICSKCNLTYEPNVTERCRKEFFCRQCGEELIGNHEVETEPKENAGNLAMLLIAIVVTIIITVIAILGGFR